MWTLYFCHVVSSNFYLSFSSSPNLSRCRLDVCHTSTHGMALVRIYDAGLKRAARGSLKYRTQKVTKNRHLGTIAHCRAISSQLRHVSTIGKKLVKQQYLPHMSSQYGELRPTSGWDLFVSLGHPSKFQRVSRLSFVTAATSLNGSQPNFAWCLAVSWAGTLYIHLAGKPSHWG